MEVCAPFGDSIWMEKKFYVMKECTCLPIEIFMFGVSKFMWCLYIFNVLRMLYGV